MATVRNKEFLILTKAKELLFNIDDILENVPRKDLYYKDKLKECCNDLVYSILMINNINDNKTIYFSKIFTNISMIDMYLERLNKKKYIADSSTKKIINKLIEINKMCRVWSNNSGDSKN